MAMVNRPAAKVVS